MPPVERRFFIGGFSVQVSGTMRLYNTVCQMIISIEYLALSHFFQRAISILEFNQEQIYDNYYKADAVRALCEMSGLAAR